MEIVLSAAASPRLSQDSGVTAPGLNRSPGKLLKWSSSFKGLMCRSHKNAYLKL